MDSTLTVLLYSSIAASAAVLGALPLIGRKDFPRKWIGWASALAAGMMLGAAYILTEPGMTGALSLQVGGAVLGILFIYWTRAVPHAAGVDLRRVEAEDPAFGYKILLIDSLHSASEGVAIGVAMAVDLSLGIFMALTIAVHNVPEATILCTTMQVRGARLGEAAGLAFVTNIGQILLAIVTFAIVNAARQLLPLLGGFASGALINLVTLELLPGSYREAGHTSIALVACVAMSIVVLLKSLLS